MRKLLCESCGADKRPGLYSRPAVYSGPDVGPGEVERVIRGRARKPTPEQRQVTFTSFELPASRTEVAQLDPSHYSCDLCGRDIAPGQVAVAWSAWEEGHPALPAWEESFLELSVEDVPDPADTPDTSEQIEADVEDYDERHQYDGESTWDDWDDELDEREEFDPDAEVSE